MATLNYGYLTMWLTYDCHMAIVWLSYGNLTIWLAHGNHTYHGYPTI